MKPGGDRMLVYRARLAMTLGIAGLAGCGPILEQVGEAFVDARVDEMAEQVRMSAHEFVDEAPSLPLWFRVNPDARAVNFFASARDRWESGFERDDPYRIPFEAQVEVETLRRALQGTVPDETFWVRPLEQAEAVVVAALRNILMAGSDTAALAQRLAQRERELDRVRQRLETALQDFAADHDFAVDTFSAAPPPRLLVPFGTDPGGGTVRVLPYLVFRKHEIEGIPADRMPWRVLATNPAPLIGVYMYRVAWPDGTRAQDRISIDSESPVTFPGPDVDEP